jgi:CheY-like chemotaxis protein
MQADKLARLISKRQRYDWRELIDKPIDDVQVRRPLLELAQKIAGAISRANMIQGSFQDEQRRLSGVKAASERVAREEAPRKKMASRRVLWVDDRPDNNIHEREAFSSYNVEFELAESTDDALDILKTDSFDAIISDMGRPPDARAGYTLLRQLRASGDQTPYFIYAGSREPEHVEEARQRGAQGCTNIGEELIDMVLNAITPQ